jgi:GT2 family glycosyltransferase
VELEAGSFAAMLIRRELFEQVGGFDEGMDGGLWCLKDFSRRACAKGFLTYLVPGPEVSSQEEQQLGSERRREEVLKHSKELYLERWGSQGGFLLHVPKGVDATLLTQKMDWLLKGARHGNSYFVLLPAALGKQARQLGFHELHENIRLVSLPRLTTEGGRRRIFEHLVAEHPGIRPVAAVDGIPFPWSTNYLQFTELAEQVRLGYL